MPTPSPLPPEPQPLEIPVLTAALPDGAPLTLRPHVDADRDAVLQRCRDPEVVRWTTIPSPYTEAMLDEYFAGLAPNAGGVGWAIEVDGAYAGSIDLRIEHRGLAPAPGTDPAPAFGPRSKAEIGYITSAHARGRGIMTEAVGMVLDHGFRLGLATIEWQAHVPNIASVKSAWRQGFVPRFVDGGLTAPRIGVVDVWHGLLAAGDPREPQGDWDTEVLPRLRAEAAAARFPN